MKKTSALRLADLPPPPAGKSGWPWTEESPAVPARLPDGSEWPLVSIVTPSFNQGAFIEETLRSVLLQNYPNLEYIVIDGGSVDDTAEVLRRYEPFLDHVVSEPDGGHADGLNKGMRRATGSILAFINSDDFYLPGTLASVAGDHRAFRRCLAARRCPRLWKRLARQPRDRAAGSVLAPVDLREDGRVQPKNPRIVLS
jgi:glycosyltransferase involved in cell wall biosynthesis